MTKKLSQYSEAEIALIKTAVLNSAAWGFRLDQSSKLVGMTARQLSTIIEEDPNFKTEYEKVRAEGIKDVAGKMHSMAKAGNFQAAAFILSRDETSPYRDSLMKVDPKELDALEKILQYLVDNNGLLPPPQLYCAHCGRAVPAVLISKLPLSDEPSTN